MATELTVLHIEDDPTFADIAAEFLTQADDDLSVVTDVNPDDALERLRDDADAIDCVVSDYGLATMDGLELLEAIRAEWPDLPFILFTGRGSEELAAEAISAGVTDYVQKNTGHATYKILAHRIRKAVERRRADIDAASGQRLLEQAVDRASDILAVVNPAHELVYVSEAVEATLGYPPAAVREQGALSVVHPDDRETVQAHLEQAANGGDDDAEITVRGQHAFGESVQLGVQAHLLDDDDTATDGMLVYTRAAAKPVESA